VVFRFSSFLAWLCCNPIWEIISSFASAHALVISYVTKGQSHRHQNKHFVWAVFLISRSIWIAFHYLTSVDNDLQSKQTVATDKIYSAKPSKSRLGAGKLCNFYYYSSCVFCHVNDKSRVNQLQSKWEWIWNWKSNPSQRGFAAKRETTKKAPQINAGQG